MNLKKVLNFIAIGLLLLNLIFIYLDFKNVKSEGAVCLKDPLTFSAKLLEEHNPTISCSCSYEGIILYFDGSGNKTLIDTRKQSNKMDTSFLSNLTIG